MSTNGEDSRGIRSRNGNGVNGNKGSIMIGREKFDDLKTMSSPGGHGGPRRYEETMYNGAGGSPALAQHQVQSMERHPGAYCPPHFSSHHYYPPGPMYYNEYPNGFYDYHQPRQMPPPLPSTLEARNHFMSMGMTSSPRRQSGAPYSEAFPPPPMYYRGHPPPHHMSAQFHGYHDRTPGRRPRSGLSFFARCAVCCILAYFAAFCAIYHFGRDRWHSQLNPLSDTLKSSYTKNILEGLKESALDGFRQSALPDPASFIKEDEVPEPPDKPDNAETAITADLNVSGDTGEEAAGTDAEEEKTVKAANLEGRPVTNAVATDDDDDTERKDDNNSPSDHSPNSSSEEHANLGVDDDNLSDVEVLQQILGASKEHSDAGEDNTENASDEPDTASEETDAALAVPNIESETSDVAIDMAETPDAAVEVPDTALEPPDDPVELPGSASDAVAEAPDTVSETRDTISEQPDAEGTTDEDGEDGVVVVKDKKPPKKNIQNEKKRTVPTTKEREAALEMLKRKREENFGADKDDDDDDDDGIMAGEGSPAEGSKDSKTVVDKETVVDSTRTSSAGTEHTNPSMEVALKILKDFNEKRGAKLKELNDDDDATVVLDASKANSAETGDVANVKTMVTEKKEAGEDDDGDVVHDVLKSEAVSRKKNVVQPGDDGNPQKSVPGDAAGSDNSESREGAAPLIESAKKADDDDDYYYDFETGSAVSKKGQMGAASLKKAELDSIEKNEKTPAVTADDGTVDDPRSILVTGQNATEIKSDSNAEREKSKSDSIEKDEKTPAATADDDDDDDGIIYDPKSLIFVTGRNSTKNSNSSSKVDEEEDDDDSLFSEEATSKRAESEATAKAKSKTDKQGQKRHDGTDGKSAVVKSDSEKKASDLKKKGKKVSSATLEKGPNKAPNSEKHVKVLAPRNREKTKRKGTEPSTSSSTANQRGTASLERREKVKEALKHAWNGYRSFAFGFDELKPVSKTPDDRLGGLATTLLDSLDTLWMTGMRKEFKDARDWVSKNLKFSNTGRVSVFETTIRHLGGLLSAFDLSGDEVFMKKAEDLGRLLCKSFEGTNGLPFGRVYLNGSKPPENGSSLKGDVALAEVATLQVEFRYLSSITGKKKYSALSERVFKKLVEISPEDGLFPVYLRNHNGAPEFTREIVSFGAMGDSAYEYMLKIWLQGGRTEPIYRDMYDKAIQGMHDRLLQKDPVSGLTFIAKLVDGNLEHEMEHLACFSGALLALGAHTDPLGLDSERAQRDLATAKDLTYTCYQMYSQMPTGLSPESVTFTKEGLAAGHTKEYILRPETVESLYILHKLTNEPVYQEWGWKIFEAIEKNCKTEIAYATYSDVTIPDAPLEDSMESFFIAETLKYLYLLFDSDSEIDFLGQVVFNTEAHPLRILPLVKKNITALEVIS